MGKIHSFRPFRSKMNSASKLFEVPSVYFETLFISLQKGLKNGSVAKLVLPLIKGPVHRFLPFYNNIRYTSCVKQQNNCFVKMTKTILVVVYSSAEHGKHFKTRSDWHPFGVFVS